MEFRSFRDSIRSGPGATIFGPGFGRRAPRLSLFSDHTQRSGVVSGSSKQLSVAPLVLPCQHSGSNRCASSSVILSTGDLQATSALEHFQIIPKTVVTIASPRKDVRAGSGSQPDLVLSTPPGKESIDDPHPEWPA